MTIAEKIDQNIILTDEELAECTDSQLDLAYQRNLMRIKYLRGKVNGEWEGE